LEGSSDNTGNAKKKKNGKVGHREKKRGQIGERRGRGTVPRIGIIGVVPPQKKTDAFRKGKKKKKGRVKQ